MSELVNFLTVAVISDVFHPISVDVAHPHIVRPGGRNEEVDCNIGLAHLADQSSIGPITDVDRSVFFGSVSN